jgi:hypothetical protein
MTEPLTNHEPWDEHARQGNYAQAIISLVQTRRGVSFVEITDLLEPYMEVQGQQALHLPDYPNLILWSGMSEAACTAIREALATGTIEYRPTSPLVYMIDGGFPDMPLAKSLRHYTVPHWVPVTLNPKDTRQAKSGHTRRHR